MDILATRTKDLDKQQKVKKFSKMSLKILEQRYGPNSIEVADALKDLGLLYKDNQRDMKKAEEYLQRVLDIRLQYLGVNHSLTGQSYSHMGSMKKDLGLNQEAESHFKKALSILHSSVGFHSIHVARVLNNLGKLYSITGREIEAEHSFIEALSIWRKSKHPDIFGTLNNFANLFKVQGKYAQAEMMFRESYEARVSEGQSLDVAYALFNIGSIMIDQHRDGEAEAFLAQSADIRYSLLGSSDPAFLKSFKILEKLYINLKKSERELEKLYHRYEMNSTKSTRHSYGGTPDRFSKPRKKTKYRKSF